MDFESYNIIVERKHNQILRRLYYEFTGQIIPVEILTNELSTDMYYKSNLEKALFGELDAVVKYRKIMAQCQVVVVIHYLCL